MASLMRFRVALSLSPQPVPAHQKSAASKAVRTIPAGARYTGRREIYMLLGLIRPGDLCAEFCQMRAYSCR
jgi:hypothetical protein